MNTIVAEVPGTGMAVNSGRKDKSLRGEKQLRFDEVLKGQKEQHMAKKEEKQETDVKEETASPAGAEIPAVPNAENAAQIMSEMYAAVPVLEENAYVTKEKPASLQELQDITDIPADRPDIKAPEQHADALAGREGTTKEFSVREMPGEQPETIKDTFSRMPKEREIPAEPQQIKLREDEAEAGGIGGMREERDDAKISAAAVKIPEAGDRTAEHIPVVREVPAAHKTVHAEDIRAEYMDMLKTDIVKQIVSGKQQFEVQLHPDNLGTLVIKAAYEAGKTVISIVCSEARTMQAMSQQAKELAGIMEARTGNETEVIVERPAEDYLQQEQNDQGQGREPDRQQREKHKGEFHENFDFLQQLRLGLA